MKRLLLLALVLSGGGCARVHPWERELLTLPAMQLQSDDATTHVQASREGSIGGAGALGESCGCN